VIKRKATLELAHAILAAITEFPNSAKSRVASITGMTYKTYGQYIDRMLQKNLITIRNTGAATYLQITKEGKHVKQQIEALLLMVTPHDI